jgi:histidine ammonia-lyase
MGKIIIFPDKKITVDDIWEVAKNNAKVFLSEETKLGVKKARGVIEKIISRDKIIYGINTGFGQLKNKIISRDKIKKLQLNLIKSHAVGIGEIYSIEEARAILFVRLLSLAQGYSGVRVELLEKIIEILNKNIIPCIPSQGSVGCSGDLAPLSHMSLVLVGLGQVTFEGKIVPTKKIFRDYNIKPIELLEKEGLALNNGTSVMTAIAALNIRKAENLARVADVSGSMSLEVLMGTLTAFGEDIQKVRPHEGQAIVAKNFKALCKDSEIIKSHKNCNRVQDSYTLRCIPQVHGAVRDAINYCKQKVEIELNSTTDNPLVFSETNEIKSGGNFHGEPIALAMDFLAIAVSELGNISERRTFKLLTPELNEDLPPFLIGSKEVGLNSGLMIIQYTAASLVAENKVYSHPVSVDSIPTSANQEDHVSFGTIAANKCRKIIDNVENILAIELLCASQATEFRKPLKLGKGTRIAYNTIRKNVKKVLEDRELYYDIEILRKLIVSGKLVNKLNSNKIIIK